MSDDSPDKDAKGLHAGHLIILMAMVMIGLGIAFFVIASREPVQLIGPKAPSDPSALVQPQGLSEPSRLQSP
jgi:hypothetical protein